MRPLSKPFGNVTSHPMSRRIRVVELRMLLFELFQLFHKHVEVVVRYLRLIKHVVVMIMSVKFVAKLVNSLFDGFHIALCIDFVV